MANGTQLRDRVLLLLVNGMSADQAEAWCLTQVEEPEDARRVVQDARKRITVAAEYTKDEQLGLAVKRLEDLYAKSIAGQDTKTALQAQRELNRLLSLYADSRRSEAGDQGEAAVLRRQIDLIAAHLLPLKLADESYPVEEHARLAAACVRGCSTTQVPRR